MRAALPRVVIAGLAGDAGKSLVALGVVRALVERGVRVAPFKKGPDFIDAAWLGAAARVPGRNLDTYLMSREAILGSVVRAGGHAELAVIEGNRGLFDGADARGTHSTAELAKLLGAPVVLVLDVSKTTRTAVVGVLGCRALDPGLRLSGVILNRVATRRQEALVRDAVQTETGLPVLGAIPRLEHEELPSRHLGLVPAAEHGAVEETLAAIATTVAGNVDLEAVRALAARDSAPLDVLPAHPARETAGAGVDGHGARAAGRGDRVRIGVLRDAAFSFYYPENLEALEQAGAQIVPISPLCDPELADVDALYAGGGFPEEHAAQLSENESFRLSLGQAIARGLPVWAECGGLMYLSRAIERGGERYAMVGALPLTVEHTARPQGHGYVSGKVDGANPFLPEGTVFRGHEFHYSRAAAASVPTVLALDRGVGIGGGRDGVRVGSVVAAYTHLHALGVPQWAPATVRAARGAR